MVVLVPFLIFSPFWPSSQPKKPVPYQYCMSSWSTRHHPYRTTLTHVLYASSILLLIIPSNYLWGIRSWCIQVQRFPENKKKKGRKEGEKYYRNSTTTYWLPIYQPFSIQALLKNGWCIIAFRNSLLSLEGSPPKQKSFQPNTTKKKVTLNLCGPFPQFYDPLFKSQSNLTPSLLLYSHAYRTVQ